jgi:NAD(P)H-hydrate repair Nnr-like enzyme with NAD(P)H-hydrate dehydratase domain
VLAGIMVGLAAQQAPLEQACGWGVVLHALAGGRLARRLGPLGYLARELPGELPPLMKKLRRPPGLNPADRFKEPTE